MKKILAFLAAAAVLCACGCGKQTAAEVETTGEETAAVQTVASSDLQEDFAMPAVNESGSTTAPVITQPTQPTTAFQQAPILQALEQAQNNPVTETTTQSAETTTQPESTLPGEEQPSEAPAQSTTSTTAKPPETTQKAQTAELLQSAVLAPIGSGTYTMTISAFGKDHSSDDKLSKIVRGGETAYWITIPAAGLTYKVFPGGGKYYLATPSKYCELTKAQYDSVCRSFNNAFCNFSSLKFKRSETVREGFKKYTVEYFDIGGSELSLWYDGGKLFKMQMAGESLPMTVSSGADGSYFTLDTSLEKVDYATLESLVSLAGAFFG